MLRKAGTLPTKLGSAALRYRLPWPQPAAKGVVNAVSGKPGNPRRIAAESAPVDSRAEKLRRLEAVLLVARTPLSTRKLAELAHLADGTEARTLLGEIARRLRSRGCAFQPVEVAHGVQLLTPARLAPWLGWLGGSGEDLRLSAPAMETLAAVAYRQPITRAEIESIRGVQCGELLRVLMERDLLRIVGRSEELGRPFLYGTTRKFLQVFGLRRLEQLPSADQIRNSEAGAAA